MNLPKLFSKDAFQRSLFHSQHTWNTIIMINTHHTPEQDHLICHIHLVRIWLSLGKRPHLLRTFCMRDLRLYFFFLQPIVLIILTSSVTEIIFAVAQIKINQVVIFNINTVNRCWRAVFIHRSIPSFSPKVCSRLQTIFHHSLRLILTQFTSLPRMVPQAIQKPKSLHIFML